ncbi:MAG TPA: hypothetical protein VD813_16430 [Pseudonocardia sp.]|nr:hypothetical protein [Pseudonocardia sp.]
MFRVAGFAGIGYAVAVGVENMDVLGAPRPGSPVSEIRAAFTGSAAVAGTVAGGLALLFFVVFAAGLHSRLAAGGGWAVAGLVGGVLGPALAMVGVAADAVLLARVTGLPDESVRGLFAIHPRLQLLAGPFVALFLLGSGIAGLRTGRLTPRLARSACVLAVPLALTPLALFDPGGPVAVAALVGFGLFSMWVFLTGLWLVLAGPVPDVVLVRRAVFLVLVVAAGGVGVALLVAPAATPSFFSWGLAPPPLAAFAGGAYLGSAAVYGAALYRPVEEVRGLVAAAAVLSSSVLVVTLVHLEQFDFARLQAWAWIVLFGLFTLLTTGLLVVERADGPALGTPLASWQRLLLTAVAAALAVLAVALWAAPEAVSAISPFRLAPLGGRFAGCWFALLATAAAWAAWRGTAAAARYPALALLTLPAGMLLAALRTIEQHRPGATAWYLAGLMLLLVAGGAALARTGGHGSAPEPDVPGRRAAPAPRAS